MQTVFTRTLKVEYPIIVAPMFLVSNEEIVVEGSEAGALGTFPALNYRPIEKYIEALKTIRQRTKKPIGVNIIVNKSNTRQALDLKHALDNGVDLFITSLGSPKQVIEEAHRSGAKVYCDVTNLAHAEKVQDMGADGVIAVGSGAGGHAGPVSPLVLIPWLKQKLKIPVIAAGGIANGSQIAACLALGAAGVSIGTRFIASQESKVAQTYKDAIIRSSPEDIVLTSRISGTPASVIRTPFIDKQGLDLPFLLRALKKIPQAKSLVVPLIHLLGMKSLEKAAVGPTWKEVWSAGQSVGLIDDVMPTRQIIERLMSECRETVASLKA